MAGKVATVLGLKFYFFKWKVIFEASEKNQSLSSGELVVLKSLSSMLTEREKRDKVANGGS